MARKKKNSNLFWYVLGGFIILIAAIVFLGNRGPGVDYSQYPTRDADVVVENPTATIEVFEDFQCPACKAFQPTLDRIKAENPDVEVVFRHFPLTQIHPYAQLASEASECARDQGRFWAYHDLLFDVQPNLAKPQLEDYADGLGLDTDAFETCMDTRAKQVVVAADQQEGIQRQVTGTPTVFVDGEQVPNSYAAIADALA